MKSWKEYNLLKEYSVESDRLPSVETLLVPLMRAICQIAINNSNMSANRQDVIDKVKDYFILPDYVWDMKHKDGRSNIDHMIDLAISCLRKNGLLIDEKKFSGVYTINDDIFDLVITHKLFGKKASHIAYEYSKGNKKSSVMDIYKKMKTNNLI